MKPSLYILSRPSIDLSSIDRFTNNINSNWSPQGGSEPQQLIEFAARVCYMSFGKAKRKGTNEDFLRDLIKSGHESVLEHACWSFILSNVTRSFTHQLVRHRVGFSFSQMSQQYVDQENFCMEPLDEFRIGPEAKEVWLKVEGVVRKSYKDLKDALEKDIPKNFLSSLKERRRYINTIARQILPNATSTTVVFSANARSLRHFLKTRGAIEGDPEMRRVCVELCKLMKVEAPAIFEDFCVVRLESGTNAVKHVSISPNS